MNKQLQERAEALGFSLGAQMGDRGTAYIVHEVLSMGGGVRDVCPYRTKSQVEAWLSGFSAGRRDTKGKQRDRTRMRNQAHRG